MNASIAEDFTSIGFFRDAPTGDVDIPRTYTFNDAVFRVRDEHGDALTAPMGFVNKIAEKVEVLLRKHQIVLN